MLLAILVLLAAAALLSVFDPLGYRLGRAVGQAMPPLAWLVMVTASALATVAGALSVSGHVFVLKLGELGGLGQADLRLDRLSGLFVLICFAVAVPVLLAGANRAAAQRPRLPAAIAMTLAAVLVILTADHLFVLLFGWEALTFAFYLLSGFDRHAPDRPRASVSAAMFGKVSGAALLAGGLLLTAQSHSFLIADLGVGPHGVVRDTGYGLLLLGFGVKVGLVPLQIWLPPTYAAAPGPARPVMAGVAVNVGFYGMWRTLEALGSAPIWLSTTVLVIAGITAILGIAHSAVHPDLAQLIAWSSVENAGLITAGFGAALVGSTAHNPQLQAAGLLAATAQIIAHALGKSLLFTAASAIEADTGTTELDALRAITRRLPWAGTGLIIGSLTLAGLPLTAGFASEWLTLESLMQQFRVSELSMQLASAAAGALVALTVGVAGVTFVRLIALTAFGAPPTEPRSQLADRAIGHRCAIAALSIGCLGVAAVAPLEVRLIGAGLRPLSGQQIDGALKSPWVLQPVFAKFSALSPTWLWLVIPAITAAIALVATLLSGTRLWRVRRVPAWSSASPGVDRGVGYTSFGWANPMRKVLANLLLTRGQLREAERGDQLLAPDPHPAEPTIPGFSPAPSPALQYRVDIVEVVGRYLYQPVETALRTVVRVAKRLQSGRLDAYLVYMLIALVTVLAIVAAVA